MENSMISGNISKQIFTFSIPIVLGNIFQQLYNTADAIVVGRLLGKNAYAAVCVAEPIMSVVLFFMVGLCMGVSALLSQCFGAGDRSRFKIQYSTGLIAGIIFAIISAVICILLSNLMLNAVQTPDEIFSQANSYLKIIFVGMIFSFLYNYYASSLRSIGDSKAAFIFLVISAIANIILDILFIMFTPLKVSGVAIATAISQALSCMLCRIYIKNHVEVLDLKKDEYIIKSSILKKTIIFSWAAALQQTCLYIGRLLVQSTINAHGTDMIAGYNAAIRLESFFMAFIDGTGVAQTTFAGQNLGANKPKRLKSGLYKTIMMNFLWAAIIGILMLTLSYDLIGLYVSKSNTEAVNLGVIYIHIMPLPYFLACLTSSIQGFFRGVGKVKITLIATMSQILIRCILALFLVPKYGIYGVCLSVIIGWIFMAFYDCTKCYKYLSKIEYNIV